MKFISPKVHGADVQARYFGTGRRPIADARARDALLGQTRLAEYLKQSAH